MEQGEIDLHRADVENHPARLARDGSEHLLRFDPVPYVQHFASEPDALDGVRPVEPAFPADDVQVTQLAVDLDPLFDLALLFADPGELLARLRTLGLDCGKSRLAAGDLLVYVPDERAAGA